MIPIRNYFTDEDRLIIPDLLANTTQGKQDILIHLLVNKNKHSFRGDIYGDTAILKRLQIFFHGKCAFCEKRVGLIDFDSENPKRDWQIEHFRPKKAVQEDSKHTGYYWLGYECTNFLVSCSICNEIYKKTHFPIENETQRLSVGVFLSDANLDWAKCDVRNSPVFNTEKPLLLNPVFDRGLHRHFEFKNDGAIDGMTPQGKASILYYGLDRPELIDARREVIDNIRRAIAKNYITLKRQKLNTVDFDRELIHIISTEMKQLRTEISEKNTPFIALRVAIFKDFNTFILSNKTPPFDLPDEFQAIYRKICV